MFSKPNALVYVRRGGLIIAGKHIKPARFTFPEGLLVNLEVTDVAALVAQCTTFFEQHETKGQRVLVVLDDSVVFTKKAPVSRTTKATAVRDEYLAAMPFEPGVRSCLLRQSTGEVELYATNSDIYNCITEALRASGIAKLIAVTPVAAYGLASSTQLSGALVEQLMRDTTVRASLDFTSTRSV